MNGPIDPFYYGFACTMVLWLILLSAVSRVNRAPLGWFAKWGTGCLALLLVLLPASELPLWRWAFSFCPNPNLVLLGIVCAAVAQRLFRIRVFAATDWRAAWLFGAVAGTVLYLHPFCFSAFDLYYWGSHPHVAAWTLAGTSVLFLSLGYRFGVVFLLALVAYDFQVLESLNGWEYVIDPFYWLISVGVVITQTARAIAKRGRRPQVCPAGPEATARL